MIANIDSAESYKNIALHLKMKKIDLPSDRIYRGELNTDTGRMTLSVFFVSEDENAKLIDLTPSNKIIWMAKVEFLKERFPEINIAATKVTRGLMSLTSPFVRDEWNRMPLRIDVNKPISRYFIVMV